MGASTKLTVTNVLILSVECARSGMSVIHALQMLMIWRIANALEDIYTMRSLMHVCFAITVAKCAKE